MDPDVADEPPTVRCHVEVLSCWTGQDAPCRITLGVDVWVGVHAGVGQHVAAGVHRWHLRAVVCARL